MRWRLGAVLLTASALAGGCGALEGGTDEGSAGPEPAAQEWGGDGGITVQVVGEEVPETARRAPDEFQIPESETSPKTDAAPGEKEEEPPDGDPVPGLEADPKTGAGQAPAAGRTSDGAGIMESEESRETGDAQSRLQGEEAGDREILDPALVYPGEILEEEDVKLAGEEGFFAINPIDDYIFGRMDGSSYREGCPVAREDLRYLLILHYDFSGNIRGGAGVPQVCQRRYEKDIFGIVQGGVSHRKSCAC